MLSGSLEMGLKYQVFVLCLSIQFFTIAATTNSYDAAALNSLKDIWKNFPPTWRGSDPCEDWVGIRCSNSRVISITLPSMKLSGPLSGDITALSELQILDLSYNKDLTGSLPTTIGDLKNLTSLILVGCGLSGPIPDSIGHLSKLVYLSLNSNSFIGPIPRTIGNLAELYWLDLADNKLTGTIPVSSGNSPGLDMLVHTKHFHLGMNQLSGTIPEQLFSANMVLIHVLFDSNSLTGTLPTSLGLVQTLEVVRFDRNQLNGPVPSNLNNLSNVNELFLSNNKITGSIPDLTGLNSLNYLDMSNNSFDPSDFPTWFSTLQSLTTWMMDKTQLQGQVPPEFFSLPHLQTVVMRNNQLNGSMNISNNHSKQLKLVDLTGNQISSIVTTIGADDVDFILQSNPLCEESGETKDFCIPEVEISPYSTQSNNCIPGPCSSAQISSPNCHCAYPYTGTLAFRAPPFSDLENFTYFTTLEEHMVRTFQSYQLPVDSISLSKPHKDSNEYLNLTLRVFPSYDKDSFNRTGVSSLGFVLSNQTYKPPHGYGPYIFMAEDYQHFAGESRSKKSTNIGIIIGAAAGGCVLLLLLIFVGVYAHHQKKIAQKANKQNPFAHWDQTKSSGNIPQLKGARCFSFEEVNKYTNHFSEANVIGPGGYGKVYKGTLPTGELVAVKRAQQGSIQAGAESSWREPDTVKKARQNPNRREPDTVKKVIQNPNPGGTDMGLESVGDLPLKEILSKLDSKHTAIVACVNRGLRKSASEDSLWRKICKDELDLHSPVNLYGNSLPSFKETYQAWRESFNMYPWPLVIRVKRCCDRLKNWLTINLPEAKATLRKGASEADIQKLENILKVKLPLPTRILYRLCDGQECSANDSDSPVGLGLIGGYCFYDHSVNVYLLPLSQIITETREITGDLSFNSRSKYILVAASLTSSFKFFFLNCTNGQLYVGTRNFLPDGEMLPCVPKNLINLQNASSDQQQDAMLLWLEEHARQLENGIIKIRKEGNIRSINLFPEKPPLCSTAITNGVRVRASSVFIPEAAKLQGHSKKYLFAYSIRMSLMPEGCITGGMNFSSCQLHQRHWVIRANDVVVSDVNGEAVIGMFPLLRPGEEEFVYESRAPLPTSSGSVRGSFTFVPGRLTDPEGGPFDAEVAEFSLCRPDYIF